MDINLPAAVIASIAEQAARIADALAPVGVAMSGGFIILAIILLGASVMTGGGFLAQLIEMSLWATGALFLCSNWGTAIRLCLQTSDQALALFGIDGTTALFKVAAAIADRFTAEPLAWEWSVSGAAGAMFRNLVLAVCVPIIAIALAIPGLLALLAQVTLILGAAAAPLILPGLAWSPTRPLGYGVITFMVGATAKIVVLGLVSTIFAAALQAQLAIPGTGVAISMSQTIGVLLTAMLAAVAGFSANGIAGNLVGHGVGGLGLSSFARPAAMVSAMSGAAGGAMSAAGSGAAAAGGPAGRAAGSMARAVGNVTTRSSGNPFGP